MKLKRFIAASFLLIIACLLTGCMLIDEVKYANDICRQMVDAIISGNSEAAWQLMSADTDRGEFDAAFDQAHAEMADAGEYRLFINQLNATRYSNATVTSAAGRLRSDAGHFVVNFDYNTEIGLRYFSITQGKIAAETDIQHGGLFYIPEDASEAGLDILDIAAIVLWLLVLVLAIFLIRDCVRQPVQKKGIWILVMLLCTLTFEIPVDGNEFVMTLPLGEIIYLFKRKKLISNGLEVMKYENE